MLDIRFFLCIYANKYDELIYMIFNVINNKSLKYYLIKL